MSPLGAARLKADSLGSLVQPEGDYQLVKAINPMAAPDADTSPFYKNTLDKGGVVAPPHDSARQILDTVNVKWGDEGKPFDMEFNTLDDLGADQTVVARYNPSPLGKK